MRQIMIARNFMQTHPRKGEVTNFVEKILKSLEPDSILLPESLYGYCDLDIWKNVTPKHHTIRSGKHWKTGDKVQLKVWSGKPYRSKTITVTPPLTLTVFDIEICNGNPITTPYWRIYINGGLIGCICPDNRDAGFNELAKNDGLSPEDMYNWFIPNPSKFTGFSGQLLCWNPEIKY